MGNAISSVSNYLYTTYKPVIANTEDVYAHFSFGGKSYKLKVPTDTLFDYLEKIITEEKNISITELNDMLVSNNDNMLLLIVSHSCSPCENKSRIKRTKTRLSLTNRTQSKTSFITTQNETFVKQSIELTPDTSREVCYVSINKQ